VRTNTPRRLRELRALAAHALAREFPEQLQLSADRVGGGASDAEKFQAQVLI
jgi:hypothetical protein